jgi:bacterioferritin-associated ferredoxin
MYVCLCNAFTDRHVREVHPVAGKSAARVYRALGVQPKCGKCVPMVREIIGEMEPRAASCCTGAETTV